jgi:hypothetical protein
MKKSEKKILLLIIFLINTFLIIFLVLTKKQNNYKKSNEKEVHKEKRLKKDIYQTDTLIHFNEDTSKQLIKNITKPDKKEIIRSKNIILDTNNFEEIKTELKPSKARSIFHDYWVSYFPGAYKNKEINIDDGKKIVCLFNPKNSQEVEVAKSLSILLKNNEIPPVFSLFGNCGSDEVFEFYKKARCNFPTTETSKEGFENYLGIYKTPAVFYLWNGNIIKVYEGNGINKFNEDDLKKECNAKYVPKETKL